MDDAPRTTLDIDPALQSELDEILHHARRFGQGLKTAMQRQPIEAADRLSSSAVAATQKLFSKWNLEILYLLAIAKRARFSDLKKRLGAISSRTLSNKLKELESEGLILRMVADQRPLRVDYELTEEGLKVAALTTPLVAYLNQQMVGDAHGENVPGRNAATETPQPA
ncbi:MAG: helix-turn-helix transcriptional regulator [Euryarchaeota archaeon]|nr:helix-turn-helix transcriptional regulator [Euryarchaeota archaeon]